MKESGRARVIPSAANVLALVEWLGGEVAVQDALVRADSIPGDPIVLRLQELEEWGPLREEYIKMRPVSGSVALPN
jgi:hypothetical protein